MKQVRGGRKRRLPRPRLRQRSEQELLYSENIYAAVAKASSLFVSSSEVDYKAILEIMAESVSANRAYIFQLQEDGSRVSNTFEWCSPGTDPQINMLQNLETGKAPWWMEQLLNRRNIVIRNVDELPSEAIAEAKILKDQHIQSVVVVPVWSRGQTLLGFMGFDDTETKRNWSTAEVEALRIVGEMISADWERRAAEDILRFEREQLLSIFDSLEAIVYITDPRTHEILYVNRTTKNAIQEDLIGRTCFREFQGREEPCEFCTNHIILKQKPAPYRWENFNPVLGKDYDIIDRIIKWPDDREVRFEFAIDITQRKQMVEELSKSEKKFRTLAEASLAGIFILQDGRFCYANPALERIFGYDANEIAGGMQPFEVTHPEDREASEAHIAGFLENREKTATRFSFRGVKSNGDVIDCELLAGVVEHEGKPALIGTILDITARKLEEEELARTQRLESLGVLAGGIAHDFNNILTAICTNISMMRMYGNLEDDISRMAEEAEEASLRAKNLTQQLLGFAKGGKPIKRTVSIVNLLRDEAEFALSGSKVRSEYSIPEDLWHVEIDEGQIGQVIHNLAINADQAMPEGGIIDIAATNIRVSRRDAVALREGRYVRISVKDHGTGISRKHLKKIFDPFFTTKQKGSGLGLATSYAIVRSHGGHMEVHSELDIGTTVHVYLPASGETPRTGTRKEERIKGEGRVLLIDDDEMIGRSTTELLRRFGYDVEFAKDGEECVKAYKSAKGAGQAFDVVVLDLTIRGGRSGKDTVREIMKIDPDAKVIVSSGYSDDPVMSDYRKYGFVGVVQKPYRSEDLGLALDRAMEGKEG